MEDLAMDTRTTIFREISFGSDEYDLECSLREEVLRKPLGLSLWDEDLREERDQIHFGLFEPNGDLTGCVVAVPRDCNGVKIRQMAVSTSHQGKGAGRQIMRELERNLGARGIYRFGLHARASAVEFYQKLGYTVTGEEFLEVTIPHFKMEKII